jgi:hypothetical protein
MSFRKFFQRKTRDREFSAEIESYIEHEIDRNLALGMDPADARTAARRKFGNPTLIQEDGYRMSTFQPLEMVLQDFKYGLRQLRNSPGFAATAILSLALGVGANTAIFQLLNAVRLRSLPVQRPNELAEIKVPGSPNFGLSEGWAAEATYPLWEQVRDNQQAFSDIFAWGSGEIGLGPRGNQRKPAMALWMTGSGFKTLGVTALRGRMLTPEDDRPGCGSGPVVISHALWQRRFDGRDDAIGAKLIIDDHPFTIAGVTPPDFFGL